jgi:hypothetical protein
MLPLCPPQCHRSRCEGRSDAEGTEVALLGAQGDEKGLSLDQISSADTKESCKDTPSGTRWGAFFVYEQSAVRVRNTHEISVRPLHGTERWLAIVLFS